MRIIGKESAPVRRRSKLTQAGSVKLHFQEFCQTSTIHGIRYFGEEDRPILERISWVTLFMICMSLNVYLILQVWKKWTENPVIVTFDETATPIWNVPFPAVTICSEVKSRATVFNFTHYALTNDTDELIKKHKGYVSLLCDDHIQFAGEDYADESTMEFLEQVAPKDNETIMICRWINKFSQNCTSQFTKIVTDEGICYSFNMLDKEDMFRENVITEMESDDLRIVGWSQDEGYTTEALVESYPRRALFSGSTGGLFIVPAAVRDDADHYCKGPVEGFKVLIHSPAEFPLVGQRYLRIPVNQEVLVMVQPNIMTTSESLRSYYPHQRHCYFPSERYLSFFKIYNQPNCEMECLTNYTWLECGCVALHMPNTFHVSAVNSAYKSETMGSCDCLPACTSISYNGELTQADFNFLAVVSAYNDDVDAFEPFLVELIITFLASPLPVSEYSVRTQSSFPSFININILILIISCFGVFCRYDASRVSIFFKEVQFTTSHRSELYGIVDFLANCGGLLGLFYGVSVLSFVELLYYSTLRLWANLKELKRRRSNA